MIYHYTSIQTLALILRHKTIRFNRLDRVDDIEESVYGSGPDDIKTGQYCFVSCWTKDSSENLALWNMYSGYGGVRIGLDDMPLETFQVTSAIRSFIEKPVCYYDGFKIDAYINPAELIDIKYVDDPKEEISKLIQQGANATLFQTGEWGLYKRKEWSIQQECRFKIVVSPCDTSILFKPVHNSTEEYQNHVDFMMSTSKLISQKHPLSIFSIDVPLDRTKLDNIEVMLGPLTTDADRIIVEALLKEYPHAVVRDSLFKGKIRAK